MTLDELRPYVGREVTVAYNGDARTGPGGSTLPEDCGAEPRTITGLLQLDGVALIGSKGIHPSRITAVEEATR